MQIFPNLEYILKNFIKYIDSGEYSYNDVQINLEELLNNCAKQLIQ